MPLFRPRSARCSPILTLGRLLTLIALLLIAAPVVAQDGPADPPANPANTETSDSPASPGADDSGSIDSPDRLVGQVSPPWTLGGVATDVLDNVNWAVSSVLFFDVSFAAFQETVTDDNGEPVYDREPIFAERATSQAFVGHQVGPDGEPLFNDDGTPVTVRVEAGSYLQKLGAGNVPQFDQETDPQMQGPEVPFLVVFLATGAIFFTLWHGFINLRGFKHASQVVAGKYSNPDDPGDIPPFRALTSALSATVGLGNIAGVAVAMFLGGPGALFWMMVLGLFGMTAKFHETTLAQLFRRDNPDGTVSGGPMFYLDAGLKQIGPGLGGLGKVLAVVFAIFTMGASLGGGNMFQSNQAFEGFYSQFVAEPSLARQTASEMSESEKRQYLAESRLQRLQQKYDRYAGMDVSEIRQAVPADDLMPLVELERIEQTLPAEEVAADATAREASEYRVALGFGLLLATLVGIVVIGGIERIGAATSRIVPTMCLLYVFGCLVVIIMNIGQIPELVTLVFTQAFSLNSASGGLVGVIIVGFQRAAFSSEAGLGSSAIAHSAAQSAEPVREGFVASLEPFIDTIVICFLTGMTVLVTNAYIAPQFEGDSGAAITLYAFEQTGPLAGWFPAILSISIVLFAFSTMISWCYYGERGWQYLFGLRSVLLFRIVFVICVFLGAIVPLGTVIDFADLMLLSMALPNIIGGVILAPLVKRKVQDYWRRYKSGEMPPAATQSERPEA